MSLLRAFKNLSIRYKLVLIMMTGSALALLSTNIAFLSFESIQYRNNLIREGFVLAEILGNNSTAALVFDDTVTAEEVLSALQFEDRVACAGLYRDNVLFATYSKDSKQYQVPEKLDTYGYVFEDNRMKISRRILIETDVVGHIYIDYDLSFISARVRRFIELAAMFFLIAMGLVYLVTIRLQKTISEPILQLSETATHVSEARDYSLRAQKINDDELGHLTDLFNEMLHQIELRDHKLVHHQEELESHVRERTRELEEVIVEREKAEKEKEGIQAQLLQSQKMEAVGVLAGGIAHDFNNLLTGIQGCTDMAMLEQNVSASVYDDLQQIQMAVERAADLTRQLLLFSRKQPMAFMTVDMNKLIEDLFKMLHRLIGEDISINTHFERSIWPVRADRGTMDQVILNLTVNARDAMANGGTFTITTDNVHVDEAFRSKHPEAEGDKYVLISLEDTGCGIEEHVLKHIFEPFYTTKGVGKGTGLGLSVVYGIIQQHEGWVEVSSTVGEGSRFDVYLPAFEVGMIPDVQPGESIGNVRGRGERILIIEDEKSVREFLARALVRMGYNVLTSKNKADAIKTYHAEEGQFDLIFSDVVLPDGTGIEVVDEILADNPLMRVIFSSGYTDHKSQWPSIQERGFQFLQKPYVLTELLAALRASLD